MCYVVEVLLCLSGLAWVVKRVLLLDRVDGSTKSVCYEIYALANISSRPWLMHFRRQSHA